MNIYKLSAFARGLIYISLFTPLFIIPYTIWEYVFVRGLVFYTLSGALIFLAAVYLYKNKQGASFFATRLFWAILIFVAARIIAGFLGVDPKTSFFGRELRMDGNIGYLALFAWLISLLLFFDGKNAWRRLFKVSVIAAFIASVFAIIQAFFPENESFISGKAAGLSFWAYDLFGSLGNPIFLAGYLLPHIFLSLFLVREAPGKSKYFWLFAAAFFIIIIFLTKTRGAIVSLFAAAVFFLIVSAIWFLVRNKKRFKKYLLFSLPILAASALLVKLLLFWTDIKGLFSLAGTAATRFILWKIGLLGFLDKPIFGWGPENFSYIFSKFYNPALLRYSFYETWADKPHNQFVEILSGTGLIGFLAFAAIFFFAFRALWRMAARDNNEFLPLALLGAAIVSYLGHIFFVFDTLESRLTLFLILGFIISAESRFSAERRANFHLFKYILAALVLIMVYSLYKIGAGAYRAAYFSNQAHNGFLNNKYSESILSLNKLKYSSSPYIAGDWEFLADTLMKTDAAGRIPKSVAAEALPMIAEGLEKAARQNPNNFSYHFRLGQMYNLMGQIIDSRYLDKAFAELLKAKEISPKRQVADLILAQIYYAKKDVAGGIKILENLVKENENVSPEPYWYLGIFYDAAGEFDKSYAYMSTAVDKGRAFLSQDERALYAAVLGRQKDYARMAPVYEEIIKYDQENPDWWANLAVVYLELKRFDDARRAARQAIFLLPAFGDEGEKFLRKVDAKEAGK